MILYVEVYVLTCLDYHCTGIPCVVLVTHVDELCDHVNKDVADIYRSSQVLECVEAIHKSDLKVKV